MLSESGGDPNYVQRVDTRRRADRRLDGQLELRARSTPLGVVIPGFSDGLNGGVTIPLGAFIRCTATNETATMTLIKNVVNDNGGTAVPSAWQLTATPVAPRLSGVDADHGTGSAAGATFEVRPGQAYNLTETGPGGYTLTDLSCVVTQPRVERPSRSPPVTSRPARSPTTTNPRHLTLVKEVDQRQLGRDHACHSVDALGDRTDTDLRRDRRLPPSRTRPSTPARYTLAESGGPDRLYGRSMVVHRRGQRRRALSPCHRAATSRCTITNTAIPPQLTLVKTVNNGTTGATAGRPAWTLAADGPISISGATGSATVTNVPVPIGTYNLSETGPPGYTASPWNCVGGTGTASLRHAGARSDRHLHDQQHRHRHRR